MTTKKWTVATLELLLIFPAALFMTALFVRNLQPEQFEPAHTAQQIVMWYSLRPRAGLWLSLIALPFAVLAAGCGALAMTWIRDAELRRAAAEVAAAIRAHAAMLLVFLATAASAGILAIVALHVLTD